MNLADQAPGGETQMDLDHAIRQIQEAKDIPPLSDILMALLVVVGKLDDDAARLRQRVEALERKQQPTNARSPYDLNAARRR